MPKISCGSETIFFSSCNCRSCQKCGHLVSKPAVVVCVPEGDGVDGNHTIPQMSRRICLPDVALVAQVLRRSNRTSLADSQNVTHMTVDCVTVRVQCSQPGLVDREWRRRTAPHHDQDGS